MHSATQAPSGSKGRLWTARILSALVTLFMLFDSVIHLTTPTPVVEAFARLGYPLGTSVGIGIIELACVVLYVIPRTAVLGAVLLTGVFGGAIAAQIRIGSSAFETYIFPLLMGLLLWGGLWLRDDRLRALVPFRTER
jgi:DoxX-like protein